MRTIFSGIKCQKNKNRNEKLRNEMCIFEILAIVFMSGKGYSDDTKVDGGIYNIFA